MAESKDKLTVAYWGTQGLAHPIRWLLAYHKIDFEDKHYTDRDVWAKDKAALPSDFPNLPYIKDGDTVITESVAVLQYAAYKTRNKDLLGKNLPDSIKIAQLNSFINDLRTPIFEMIRNPDYEKIRDETLNTKVAPFMEKISKNLGEKEFLLGYLTWVDFQLFNALDVYRRMSSEFVAKWPNLKKYWERFNNAEGIQAFRKSEKYPKLLAPAAFVTWTGEEK